jgi:DsbC/DsbD-like thiol-disulfide interchange protein
MKLIILVLLFSLFSCTVLNAQPSPASDHVDVNLIMLQETGTPGGEIMLGLHFEIEKDWHIYWQNPGDSGIPVRASWTADNHFDFSSLLWPYPGTFREEHLITYGYKDETLLMVPVNISENTTPGTYTVEAFVEYLACKRICLPGFETHKIEIEIKESETTLNTKKRSLFDEFQSKLPVKTSDLYAYFERNNEVVTLLLSGNVPIDYDLNSLQFFASAENLIESSTPQKFHSDGNALQVDLRVSRYLNEEITYLPGVLTITRNGKTEAILVNAKPKSKQP